MKRLFVGMIALAGLVAAASAQTTDPAKIEELHQRYLAASDLLKQGKNDDALAAFQAILKDEPKAKGSLYYAGFLEIETGQPEKALDYLNTLLALEPTNYRATLLLLNANQMLRRDIRVEEFRKKLYDLHTAAAALPAGTPGAELATTKLFLREKAHVDKNTDVDINEFFDPSQDPFIAWEVLQFGPDGKPVRDLMLAFNPDQTAAMQKKDPKLADVQVYLFGENVIKDGKVQQFNLYRQESAKPTYNEFRGWALDAIKQPPKPIYVQPVQ